MKMNEIKSYILEFIWAGKNVKDFEKWLYEQNSIEFEQLIGEVNYLELISYDYEKRPLGEIKKLVKSVLPSKLIQEFEEEFEKRRSYLIKGKCVRKVSLDYYDKKNRSWDVEIGKEYEFIEINIGIENGNHSALIKFIDSTNDFDPSGYYPMELFEIDLTNISAIYHTVSDEKKESIIEVIAFSEKEYMPSHYSFWEDFYNDDEKAIQTYYEFKEKYGLKSIW